jgi:CheY-like chemotaxis protein
MRRPSRILIIDDSRADLGILREGFAAVPWNAELEEATSIDAAIVSLRRHREAGTLPDLVLVDYIMSSRPCIPALAAIRTLYAPTLPPVVILSTVLPLPAMLEECYASGVIKVLEKPSDFSRVVAFIRAFKALLHHEGSISGGGSWIGHPDLAILGE